MTPMAVTAAPAPAPCTISGRAPYRSVWNMMMLSDPPSEVANGWVFGYLEQVTSPHTQLSIRQWERNVLFERGFDLSKLGIDDTDIT
jgi:hypothetical protein